MSSEDWHFNLRGEEMVAEILIDQISLGALASGTLRLSLRNRKIRKVGIYTKEEGIQVTSHPLYDIQTSTGKMNVQTQLEDKFERGDEPRLSSMEVSITDTSAIANEVTLKVTVV